MTILRRGSAPDIDFTLLVKRGIIKKPKTSQDIIDFTKIKNNSASSLVNNVPEPNVSNSTSSTGSLGDFFGNMAAFATPNENQPTASAPTLDNNEMNSLKIKVEDLEYKLDRLLERLALIDSRIDSLGR